FFFFIQAEDGIRYRNVTGVQTCALPIYSSFILSMSKQLHRVDHSFNRILLGNKNVRKSVLFSPFFCRRADADNRLIEKAMRLLGQLDKAIDRRWACKG